MTITEGIETMEGRRRSLLRNRYYKQADHVNFLIGLSHLLKKMEENINLDTANNESNSNDD